MENTYIAVIEYTCSWRQHLVKYNNKMDAIKAWKEIKADTEHNRVTKVYHKELINNEWIKKGGF